MKLRLLSLRYRLAGHFDGYTEVPKHAQHAEESVGLGLALFSAGFFITTLWGQLLMLAGAVLFVEGLRRFLFRDFFRRSLTPTRVRFPKTLTDNFRNLSYLFTTAGGFSLVAKVGDPLFSFLLLTNVVVGVWYMDFSRELHIEEASEKGVSYALVNPRYFNGLSGLVRVQLALVTLALLWFVISQMGGG